MRLGDAQQFASPQATIEHYGVKGMKWGVRKERTPVPLAVRSPGLTGTFELLKR